MSNLIRVHVKVAFRYQFASKDVWLSSYEDYYLDIQSKNDREELKYLLSARFPFRDFIYIDLLQIPTDLIKEMNDEGIYIPQMQEYLNLVIKDPVEFVNDTEPNFSDDTQISEPEPESVTTISREDRKAQLSLMNSKQLRLLTSSMKIVYSNKEDAIESILTLEYQ